MRILVILLATTSVAFAQTERVEVEPVTCWWRTNAAAVRVGESFSVVLTCSLLQTEAARVIADESRLEPAVVQLPPFEVVGGARAKDLTTAGRRFIQFAYDLRVIAENTFATDVALPPLEISYRVDSRVGGDSVSGRDLTYALPPLTMRVLSLVPDTAEDIREAPIATFAIVEGVDSRAAMFRVAAGVALAVSVLLLIVVLVSILRHRRASRPASQRVLPGSVVLNGVRRELAAVKEAVRASGWTAELAGRALAALRLVAAYASGGTVSQRPAAAGHGSVVGDGQLLVHGRLGGPIVVSASAATSDDEDLRDALARFAAARYGRNQHFDARLDDALESTARRAERLAADRPWRERLWPR